MESLYLNRSVDYIKTTQILLPSYFMETDVLMKILKVLVIHLGPQVPYLCLVLKFYNKRFDTEWLN